MVSGGIAKKVTMKDNAKIVITITCGIAYGLFFSIFNCLSLLPAFAQEGQVKKKATVVLPKFREKAVVTRAP